MICLVALVFKYHSDMGQCFQNYKWSLRNFFFFFLIGKTRHGIGKKGGYF